MSLSEDEMARVRTLADVATTVEAARRRRAGQHAAEPDARARLPRRCAAGAGVQAPGLHRRG